MPKTAQYGQPTVYNAVRQPRADGEAGAMEVGPTGETMTYEQGVLDRQDVVVAYPQGKNVTIIGVNTTVSINTGVANDSMLFGINIITALVGTIVITGFANSSGVAAPITLPAGSVGYKSFEGIINSIGGLTVTSNTAGDIVNGNISVIWLSN